MDAFRMGIKCKDDLRRYSLEELENMCPKDKRLFVRLKKLTELRQKISLTKLDGQRSSLNGKQMKEKVFMSKLLQMILNGISLVNYINGSQIHMRICHCRS